MGHGGALRQGMSAAAGYSAGIANAGDGKVHEGHEEDAHDKEHKIKVQTHPLGRLRAALTCRTCRRARLLEPTAWLINARLGCMCSLSYVSQPEICAHCGQVRARLAEIFPKIDTNHDMHIDQAEMLAWHDANGQHICACSCKF
jgi:hypothetical protein